MTSSFLDLHRPGDPLLLGNAWDAGSARILAELGYAAIATTSSGFAATLGRPDSSVSRDEALGHAAVLVAAVGIPVSADLENGFGDTPDDVARTAEGARGAGLAGFSIEDYTGRAGDPVYDAALAAERIAAAAEASGDLVLTGRCENYLHGRPDLADTIARLQAYQEAGADVLYAPGLTAIDDITALVGAVDRPVNVLLRPGGPSPAELAEAGVARISVGGTFAWAAYAGLVEAAGELLAGRTGFQERAGAAKAVIDRALA
ncbi:isocitrate lyase/PEP mutase family protein [Myceligenerans pegani]|uniref:Isocitrate lyase/phosphoenolpyruvate mutase family protein n=1 Tax=Myceligenerans pegani TaxID=2776917 RepID=A0ABR9MUH8_9MICO|nr:isocitrate lyase/phosphoenolpyruvate mutase family protein [Myceligenerans sp. TRM 65318]MBE1875025.1 isocitrate lyase/phosphoenolpyruvate mutase family protein [Myceligenerans sp. TRM 65318]MBE3017296.1 isocitrate lyase/phosphoenolpyruvate mutase family protein [Myceligenerans sp. TRM 65318]